MIYGAHFETPLGGLDPIGRKSCLDCRILRSATGGCWSKRRC